MAQRIVRAKRTLAEVGAAYETPRGADRDARIASVLEVIYQIFNERYTAAAGDDWQRPQLCDKARRLGRVLTRIAPTPSSCPTRTAGDGTRAASAMASRPWPMRRRWGEGGVLTRCRRPSWPAMPARRAEDADWAEIAAIYAVLAEVAPSPVVELNRAVAVGRAEGPAAGLGGLERLVCRPGSPRGADLGRQQPIRGQSPGA